ncbi:MAG: hypothetical protein NVS4B3_25230 [Gemmatimonadaceae bacterium]
MEDLWTAASIAKWRNALARYDEVIPHQGVASLPALDQWYRTELPLAIHARQPPHVILPELVRLTEWKMARGVWRAPNLVLVRGNGHRAVEDITTSALARIPHPTAPISLLAKLDGVGPATASAIAAAAAPGVYPFFDELVAGQVPNLGKVAWTLRCYTRYATALRERAADIGAEWTPVMVERALWAHVGGKAGIAGPRTGGAAFG